MTLNPHSSICTEFTCLPVLSAVLSSLLSSCLTSFNLIQECFLSWCVFVLEGAMQFPFDQNTPIAFLYPQWKCHFTKCHFVRSYTAPLSHKEAKFYFSSETFRQCGHVSFMLFGERSLERLYECVVSSAPGGCFSSPLHKQVKGCLSREDVRTLLLLMCLATNGVIKTKRNVLP